MSGHHNLLHFRLGERIWHDFSVRDRNWLDFLCAGRKSLGSSVSNEIDLVYCVWSKLIWFQFGGSNLAWFQSRHTIYLGIVWVVETVLFQCGSELTRFQCRDRKWLGLRAAVENESFQVNGLKLTRFLCRGIEIDSILEWASKLTWFQWWGRNHLVFYVGDRAWLDFSLGIGIDLVFHEGRKWLGFSVWNEVNLAFVSRHQDGLEFRVGIEIDLIIFCVRGVCEGGRNWLDFSVGHRNWVDFSDGIGIDVVFVCWSKNTWI